MWDPSHQPGVKPTPPAVEAQIPNQWTTREVSKVVNFMLRVF